MGQPDTEWSTFELPSFNPAKNTLMAAVNQESIILLGGKVADDDESFGILFDAQTRQVTGNVKAPADAYKFVKNAHGVTSDGHVVALAEHEADEDKISVLQVSGDGKQVEVKRTFTIAEVQSFYSENGYN